MKDERFLKRCCCDNLKDVADTTRLKATVLIKLLNFWLPLIRK